MIAKVVQNNTALATDRLYDYLIPKEFIQDVSVGMRIRVPFGKGNRTSEAYVMYLSDKSELDSLKSVISVVDDYIYFDSCAVSLIEFMRHRYFCTYLSALKCILPSGINLKMSYNISIIPENKDKMKEYCSSSMIYDKIYNCLSAYSKMTVENLKSEIGNGNVDKAIGVLLSRGYIKKDYHESENVTDSKKVYIKLAVSYADAKDYCDSARKKAPARARAVDILCESGEMELSDLLLSAQTAKSTVNKIVELGIAKYIVVTCNNSDVYSKGQTDKSKPALTPYQKNAFDKISASIGKDEKNYFLIHGVTGSGKTEVYLSLIEYTLKMGLESIFLVPEISLTPQMIKQVYNRFGDNVAVLHSGLTVKQRFSQWKKINNGEVKIAIGARSAVFAPFKKLGLLIVDEEHENTYKSEISPRYDATEIARYIVNQRKAVMLLASATPSVVSYFKAKSGIFNLIEMPERINKGPLPKVYIADMREELHSGNMSIFSNKLIDEITVNLKNKEQSILFLNRRGFSGFVSCRDCGFVMQCPNCNVSLTYHKSFNKMVCHYCNYKTDIKEQCPACHGNHIRSFGIGTEKISDEIKKLFPKASVIRMDADTTSGRMGHERILERFEKENIDILVGTQMVTKGLDFKNVTLVGIVAADMSLNADDYRAGERTFDLVTQVIGRAGRFQKKGRAVIQSYNPDDEIIIESSLQDYRAFYDNEVNLRRMLMYPPFTEFINFTFSGENADSVKNTANKFFDLVKESLDENKFQVEIFNVCQSPVFKVNGKYRYHFIIKSQYKKNLYDKIHTIYDKQKLSSSGVMISVDVNPNSIN